MVRCPECGGARAYPDAWPGHLASCSIGLVHYRRYVAERDLRAVVGALIDEHRHDVEFLERLRRRVEQEPTILESIAAGETFSFATLPLGLATTRELASELLVRLVFHLDHPELPVREMVEATYGSLAELRVMGDPRILDYRPVDDSDHGPDCDGPYNCTCGIVK